MPNFGPAVYPWYLQVETFAIIGLVVGKTAWDNKYMNVFTCAMPFLWIFNYLYLAGDHKFNWFGSFQSAYRVNCNCTYRTTPIKEPFVLFTADDIGQIGQAVFSLFILMYSFYYMRKYLFQIIWWKKGETQIEVKSWWSNNFVTKFTKNWDLWSVIKLTLLWLVMITIQGFGPIILYQTVCQWVGGGCINSYKWGLNQSGNSWNVLAYVAWLTIVSFFGGLIVWLIWIVVFDRKRELLLSQKFEWEKEEETYSRWSIKGLKVSGLLWYVGFEAIFYIEMLVFGLLQLFKQIPVFGWKSRIHWTTGFAVIFTVINLALALLGYWLHHNRAINQGENMPTEPKYEKMNDEELA